MPHLIQLKEQQFCVNYSFSPRVFMLYLFFIMVYAYFSSPFAHHCLQSPFNVFLLQFNRQCFVCGSLLVSSRGHLHTQHSVYTRLERSLSMITYTYCNICSSTHNLISHTPHQTPCYGIPPSDFVYSTF